MSLADYLLPWKAIPNMIRDVKKAGGKGLDGKDTHGSVVGAIGKYADPAGALLGDDWMKFWHERLPTQMNEYASGIAEKDPFIRADRKWGLGQKGSPLRGVSNWARARPADTAAIITGGILGGGALAGSFGAGAGGGAGAGAGGMSAVGPYAGGYAFPAGSSMGSAGMSAYGPYAGGYAFGASAPGFGVGTYAAPAGGAAAGSSAAPAAGNQYMEWAQRGQQMLGQQPGQQQGQEQSAPSLPPPSEAMPRTIGSLGIEQELEALRSRRYQAPRW